MNGQLVDGALTMFTRTLPILGGRCEAKHISFSGEMKTLAKMVPYTAEGTVNGSRIDILFTTGKGSYPAVGQQKIAGQRKSTAT